MFIQAVLKFVNRQSNLRAGIIIDARKDVGSASLNGDAIGDGNTRHLESDVEIGSAIVNSGQNVRMQINHERNLDAATCEQANFVINNAFSLT